ncbi:MAG: hypothetical protein ACHQ51_10370 [Elusimicrobiota bacterium]
MNQYALFFTGSILLASYSPSSAAQAADPALIAQADEQNQEAGADSSLTPETGQGVETGANADARNKPANDPANEPPASETADGSSSAQAAAANPVGLTPSSTVNGCNTPIAATRIGAKYHCPKAFDCGSGGGRLTPFLQAAWTWGTIAAEHGKYSAGVMGQFFGTSTCDGAFSLAVLNSLQMYSPDGTVPNADQFGMSVTDGKCKKLYPNFMFPNVYAETSRAGLSLTSWDGGFCYYEPPAPPRKAKSSQ